MIAEQEFWDSLPVIKRIRKRTDMGDCTICLDLLIRKLTLQSCGHKFHVTCITERVTRSQNCPLCRTPIEYLITWIDMEKKTNPKGPRATQIIQNEIDPDGPSQTGRRGCAPTSLVTRIPLKWKVWLKYMYKQPVWKKRHIGSVK